MFRTVKKFQTLDGQTFDSQVQAERHAQDMLCERIEALLIAACPDFNRPSTHKAVTALADNPKATAKLLRNVLNLLEYANDEEEGD